MHIRGKFKDDNFALAFAIMSSSEDEVPVVRQKKKVTNGSAKNVDGEPTTSSEPAQKDFNELVKPFLMYH